MDLPKFENPPFTFSDERWNDEEQCREYAYTDMQLRVTAKGLMLQQGNPDTVPRKRAEVERTLAHVVFELAYRTHRLDEYIEMNREAQAA